MALKNRLAKLIEELKITPYRLAKDTGVSANTIYALKNNPSQYPSREVAERIADTYDLQPNDILERVK